MGILEVMAADHAEAAALFDELTPIAGDDRRTCDVMRVATRLAIEIKSHALAEQKVLLEALRTAGDDCAAYALEALHELYALDLVIDKMLALRPGPELRAAVCVARRLFDQHMERAVAEVLPAAGSRLADGQLARDLVVEKRRVRPRVMRLVSP
ncbi:MAG TPA: hypothetical protein VFQ53_00470 [Kofleriaceae bacterium]|nr:hypothetical protein [Kofleriaceae bacterium]